MTKCKRQIPLLLAGAAAAAALVLLLRPWYHRFIVSDYEKTCIRARFVIEDDYDVSVQAELDQGHRGSTLDLDRMIAESVRRKFDKEIQKQTESDGTVFYTVEGLCRSGGSYRIFVDPDTHRLIIECSLHGPYQFRTGYFDGCEAGEW